MSGKPVRMQTSITICAYARIHVTLIGMHLSGYRINGGFGFSINAPSISVHAIKSSSFSLNDSRSRPLSDNNKLRVKNVIDSLVKEKGFEHNISIQIYGELLTHSGFGSGTIIRLAAIEALFVLNNLVYLEQDIVEASGRGGTSGIGISTYFKGGYTIDVGHKNKDAQLLPSNSAEKKRGKPLVLKTGKMPFWDIGICLPLEVDSPDMEEEKLFFASNTPIQDKEVFEALYHVIYGLYSSIEEQDKDVFSTALNAIQNCEWKLKERSRYGSSIRVYEDSLYKNGASAVGMSSLGPALVFFSEDVDKVIKKMKKDFPEKQLFLLKTTPRNFGRSIKNA